MRHKTRVAEAATRRASDAVGVQGSCVVHVSKYATALWYPRSIACVAGLVISNGWSAEPAAAARLRSV